MLKYFQHRNINHETNRNTVFEDKLNAPLHPS